MITKEIIIAHFNEDRQDNIEAIEKCRFNTNLGPAEFLKAVMAEMVNPVNFETYRIYGEGEFIDKFIEKMAMVVKFDRGNYASAASDQLLFEAQQRQRDLYRIMR